MEKKIEDYLHLYIGQPFKGKYKNWAHENETMYLTHSDFAAGKFEYIKPILRPLSDMTEEEVKTVFMLDDELQLHEERGGVLISFDLHPDTFIFLLSRGFDLFNLIPEGLALDKTKLSA